MGAERRASVAAFPVKKKEHAQVLSEKPCDPPRNRTLNLLIKSQLLCQLS